MKTMIEQTSDDYKNYCGHLVNTNMKFCPTCGEKVVEQEKNMGHKELLEKIRNLSKENDRLKTRVNNLIDNKKELSFRRNKKNEELDIVHNASLKVDDFRAKIIHRLEGYVMGVEFLHPTHNTFIIVDDRDKKNMSSLDLRIETQRVVDEWAKNINPDIKPKAFLLTDLWKSTFFKDKK